MRLNLLEVVVAREGPSRAPGWRFGRRLPNAVPESLAGQGRVAGSPVQQVSCLSISAHLLQGHSCSALLVTLALMKPSFC